MSEVTVAQNDTMFFTMPIIDQITKCKSLVEAKELAMKAITDKPNARPANITLATNMVNKAKTINKLAIDCSNFALSHEGLRVI